MKYKDIPFWIFELWKYQKSIIVYYNLVGMMLTENLLRAVM